MAATVLVLAVIIFSCYVLYTFPLNPPSQTPVSSPQIRPTGERYLTYEPYRGGNQTKVFLLASDSRYGVYERDFAIQPGFCEIKVGKGDRCVIINATIRNDYTEEWFFGYFISLTAYLYKVDGQKVGTVYTYNQNFCGMVEDKLQVGETKTYEICVAYDKQDIQYYEQYVWNIQQLPTP